MNKFKVWFIPTKIGMSDFGWQPILIDEFDNRDDAQQCAYIESSDDTAPDKKVYGDYFVIEVKS